MGSLQAHAVASWWCILVGKSFCEPDSDVSFCVSCHVRPTGTTCMFLLFRSFFNGLWWSWKDTELSEPSTSIISANAFNKNWREKYLTIGSHLQLFFLYRRQLRPQKMQDPQVNRLEPDRLHSVFQLPSDSLKNQMTCFCKIRLWCIISNKQKLPKDALKILISNTRTDQLLVRYRLQIGHRFGKVANVCRTIWLISWHADLILQLRGFCVTVKPA